MKGGLPAASSCIPLSVGAPSASYMTGLTNGRMVAAQQSSPYSMTKEMTDGSWCVSAPVLSPFWGAWSPLAFRVPPVGLGSTQTW